MAYANFYIRREAFPRTRVKATKQTGRSNENRPPGSVFASDEVREPMDEYTPEAVLASRQRDRLEDKALQIILELAVSNSEEDTVEDENLFLNFVKLLRHDPRALKDTGHHNLNAKYVAKHLDIRPDCASTLWYKFTKICRAIDDPELRLLIERIDPQWLETSEGLQRTSQTLSAQTLQSSK